MRARPAAARWLSLSASLAEDPARPPRPSPRPPAAGPAVICPIPSSPSHPIPSRPSHPIPCCRRAAAAPLCCLRAAASPLQHNRLASGEVRQLQKCAQTGAADFIQIKPARSHLCQEAGWGIRSARLGFPQGRERELV